MRGTGLWIFITISTCCFKLCVCDNTESSHDTTDKIDDDVSNTTTTVKPNVHCRTPGELVPNTENCRKYYKCSNGEPSLQSCPGTLIFDPVLKICNWPDSTTCISDLIVRPSRPKKISPGFGSSGDKVQDPGSSQFSKDILHALQRAATEKPVIVNVTPANKLSKRILSLFAAKDRKRNNRIKTNTFSNKNSDIKSRISAFRDGQGRRDSNRPSYSFDTTTQSPSTSSSTKFIRNKSFTTTTRRTSTTTKRTTTTESPRVKIRPFALRQRQNPFKSKEDGRIGEKRDSIKNVVRQAPYDSYEKVTEKVDSVTEADDEVVTKVRSESSVSSITSSVRVSVGDLAFLNSGYDERPFSNGRGGDQFDRNEDVGQETEEDYMSRLRQELELSSFSQQSSPATTQKPKAKPIKCHTGASNELYANPRNCRKYYKCQNGEPSLQSCPANLIFDTNLKICNWPTASTCEEDPEAPLPDHVTSDREPPQAINAINIDDYDTPAADLGSKVSSLPHPDHATVPTIWEARQREEALKAEYPQFVKVKQTVKTLDTKLVEKVSPGNPTNPDNVKRVEFILSEENYEDLFPRHHPSYTYRRLLQAIAKFPAICSYVGREETSDSICRKTLATMFAHFTQETGAHNPSDKEFDEWRQGLNVVREQGCTDTSPGCGYNDNCEDTDSITRKWSCGKDVNGKWRKYYGRGAKQLSYNFNYGQFSQAMFDDRRLLLDHPDFVADTWLNMASATWFYTTPQPPKPSMLHVIDGTWVPNEQDKRNGISPGFGATINIINGGVECNTRDGKESKQAVNRIEYYKQFAWYLYVDYQHEELGCAKQKQFSAGGAGALPIYWDKDWSYPYSCKLVNYQTAHSALVDGEYIDCVEENFNVNIR